VTTSWQPNAAVAVGASQRWIVVAVTFMLVAWLAYTSVLASAAKPWLGLSAASSERGLVVQWVQPGGWAWDSGIRPGDAIISIDGLPVDALDSALVGSASRVQVRSVVGELMEAPRGGEPIPDTDPLRWAFLLTAASFLLVGGAIYVLASERRPALLMLAHATSGAVLLSAAVATPSGAGWAVTVVYLSLVGFGASTVLLCLVQPIDRLGSRAGQRVALVTLLSHVCLIGAFGYVVLMDSAAYDVLRKICFTIISVDLLGAVGLTVAGVRATPTTRRARRHALTLVALGMITGCLPFVFLSLVPHTLGLGMIVPAQLAVLSFVLAPASFAVGILSRQFFGIERIVRRGLVALVVWIPLLGVYVLGLDLLSKQFSTRTDAILVAIVVTAGTFAYLQWRARAWVESLLFRDTYVYADAVQRIGREIVSLHGVEAITTHVLEQLGRVLDLSWAVLSFEPATAHYTWGSAGDVSRPLLVEPLIADGVPIGSLSVGPKVQDVELQEQDHALIRTLAPLVATALQSAVRERNLEQQVQLLHRREEELVALSDRLMRVQEDDRHHLALDLHDDPLQRAILLAREMGEEPHDARSVRWRRDTEEIIASLRAICTGLRPRVLDDLGLEAGLGWLVNNLRARTELDVNLSVGAADGEAFSRLPADLEIALFRVAQEALANCLRHADAGMVSVEVFREGQTLRLLVQDDGVGLRSNPAPDRTASLGVLGMRERLRAWGGSVSIQSIEPLGTLVVAEVGVPR